MSEHERERLFWGIAVFLCLLSPAAFLGVHKVKIYLPREWEVLPLLAAVLIGSIVIAILIEVLAALLTGNPLRFAVKNLTTRLDEQVLCSPEQVREKAQAALSRLGFTFEGTENSGTILFKRITGPEAHHFMDHDFEGSLTCSPTAFGTRIQADLVFKETVVFDTGETRKLQALCRQICGLDTTEEPPCMPFIVPVGLTYALIGLGLGVASLYASVPGSWLMMTAGIGTLMNLSAIVRVYGSRRHIGLRVSLASVYLTMLPLMAAAARTL